MNKLITSAAILAAAVAPQATLAATVTDDTVSSITSGTRFEIIDPATNKVVAILLPVGGTASAALRIIGAVRTTGASGAVSTPISRPLTIEQEAAQSQQEFDADFHVNRSP